MSLYASVEVTGPLDGLGEPSMVGRYVRFTVRSKDGRTIIVRIPFAHAAKVSADLVSILSWANVPLNERPEAELREAREKFESLKKLIEGGSPISSAPTPLPAE